VPGDIPGDDTELNLAEAGQLEEAGVPTLLSSVTNPVHELMTLGFTRPQVYTSILIQTLVMYS
jgi:hypothetical protein